MPITEAELSAAHKERLEEAGWKVGDVAEFLGVDEVTEHFEEFYVSCNQWWPFYTVPLYNTHMLMAVTVGDAEVEEKFWTGSLFNAKKVTQQEALENESSSDIYFRWVRAMKDRKRIYPEMEGRDPGELSGLPSLRLSKELEEKYMKIDEDARKRKAIRDRVRKLDK